MEEAFVVEETFVALASSVADVVAAIVVVAVE